MAKATKAGDTTLVTLPTSIVGDITKKMQDTSVIMSLAQAEPQIFSDAKHIFFSEEPEAEYIGEGEAKSSSTWRFEPIPGKIHKMQTTVRMTDEVTWADEDNRLQILDTLTGSMANSLARGLDYGMLHAINPLTKTEMAAVKAEAIGYTGEQVEATDDVLADLDNLPDSIIGDYDVTGIALDRKFANEVRKLRWPSTGMRMFPEVGLDLNPGTLDGLRSVTSRNVSGDRLATTPTGIKAILGDWNLVKWGVVRDFALEEIRFGDPDGLGDLRRYNQIAFRVEMVFSWCVLDPAGFAVYRAPSGSAGA